MRMWLEIDGERFGEIDNFKMDEPPKVVHWGPIFVHQRQPPPDTCSFTISGPPPRQGGWVNLVGEDGIPIHEIAMLSIDTRMGLGSATSTVKAKIL